MFSRSRSVGALYSLHLCHLDRLRLIFAHPGSGPKAKGWRTSQRRATPAKGKSFGRPISSTRALYTIDKHWAWKSHFSFSLLVHFVIISYYCTEYNALLLIRCGVNRKQPIWAPLVLVWWLFEALVSITLKLSPGSSNSALLTTKSLIFFGPNFNLVQMHPYKD